jgi:2-dehydro-3-deoxyphosphogluconate aldolase / (4S)-4-hydroxy-2-oxoglutarate aldolase
MKKEEVRQRILDVGVVPVVRASSSKLAIAAADAICAGGISIIEVTMTVPGAIDVIQELVLSMGTEILIGAGTVLDVATARQCIDAGAEFIVGPTFDPETVKLANRENKLVMAGALTPTEVVNAWKNGADFVKIFPCGNVGGPKYIKALKAPLPQIHLVPTGGVSLTNAAAFIRAGASALGVGAELVSEAALASGNGALVTRTAQLFINAVREARQPTELITSTGSKGNHGVTGRSEI